MDIALPIILLIGGIVLLVLGANWLVDGAVIVARSMGMSTLWIGLTMVAFGTSAPELAVNLLSAIDGHPSIAFGNVIGSNIANVGLVIGLGALIAPIAVQSRVVKLELPLLTLITAITIGLAMLPATAVGSPGVLGFSRIDGGIMLTMFVGFFVWLTISSRKDGAVEAPEIEATNGSVMRGWLLFIVGLVALIGGAKATETGAVQAAMLLNISEAIIGLTIVAIATSLPEVITVVVAMRKGQADLAVGNVVGSNIFNLLLVLATTATIAEVPMPADGLIDMIMMLVMTVMLLVVSITHERMVNRIEGVVLLAAYFGFMTWRVVQQF